MKLVAKGQLSIYLIEVLVEDATLHHKNLDVTEFESLKILKESKPDVVI